MTTETAQITLIVASIRPESLGAMLDNVEKTAANPAAVEVLIKIDQEDTTMLKFKAEESARSRPMAVCFFVTPRGEGYWGLYKAYDEIVRSSAPDSYFVFPINDQLRFATKGWDAKMLAYKGRFPDGVFHLRFS